MTCQAGWGHPQSNQVRSKIARALAKVWVIERIRQYSGDGTIEFNDGELLDCEGLTKGERTVRFPGRPPFTVCDIPSERAFLRVTNLRKFCRDESLDYGNLRKTFNTGGWCSDYYTRMTIRYAIRACLETDGAYYEIPCEKHSRYGGFTESCADCKGYSTWPEGKPVRITFAVDRDYTMNIGPIYKAIYPEPDMFVGLAPRWLASIRIQARKRAYKSKRPNQSACR